MKAWLVLVFLLLGLAACSDDVSESMAAQGDETSFRMLQNGKVVGFKSEEGAHNWLGLPFARPPVDQLRWRAPRPPENWQGTRQALAFGSGCLQPPSPLMQTDNVEPGVLVGSEDCLYLNVYAPAMTSSEAAETTLPVMFWIHGGGNTIGEASQYDASQLAVEQNVVVVTTNYRMGPLGWFRHSGLWQQGDTAADKSGNFGTLDMIRSLEWTRDNIAAFGGDPANVTIFGESAGGLNVFSMLMSPLSQGLFHKAISQSGLNMYYSLQAATQSHPSSSSVVANTLLKENQLNSVTELRSLPAQKILGAYIKDWEAPRMDLPMVFKDGYVLPMNAGQEALEAGSYHRVPIMMGTNRDEDKLFMFADPEFTDTYFGFWLTSSDAQAYDRRAYYLSTRWRAAGAEEPARAIEEPVYVYRFDWDEQGKPLFMDFPHMLGAAHALEIAFVFGSMSLGPLDDILITDENSSGRHRLSQAMMTYWGNFARHGNPNMGHEVPAQWQPWSETEQYIVFDTEQDGGVRMSKDTTSFNQIIAELAVDPAYEDVDKRCALFSDMQDWVPEMINYKSAVEC